MAIFEVLGQFIFEVFLEILFIGAGEGSEPEKEKRRKKREKRRMKRVERRKNKRK